MLSVSLLLRVLGGNTALVEALRNPARPYVEETYDCLDNGNSRRCLTLRTRSHPHASLCFLTGIKVATRKKKSKKQAMDDSLKFANVCSENSRLRFMNEQLKRQLGQLAHEKADMGRGHSRSMVLTPGSTGHGKDLRHELRSASMERRESMNGDDYGSGRSMERRKSIDEKFAARQNLHDNHRRPESNGRERRRSQDLRDELRGASMERRESMNGADHGGGRSMERRKSIDEKFAAKQMHEREHSKTTTMFGGFTSMFKSSKAQPTSSSRERRRSQDLRDELRMERQASMESMNSGDFSPARMGRRQSIDEKFAARQSMNDSAVNGATPMGRQRRSSQDMRDELRMERQASMEKMGDYGGGRTMGRRQSIDEKFAAKQASMNADANATPFRGHRERRASQDMRDELRMQRLASRG